MARLWGFRQRLPDRRIIVMKWTGPWTSSGDVAETDYEKTESKIFLDEIVKNYENVSFFIEIGRWEIYLE